MLTLLSVLTAGTLDRAGHLLLPFLDEVLTEARSAMLGVHETLAEIHDLVRAWQDVLEP